MGYPRRPVAGIHPRPASLLRSPVPGEDSTEGLASVVRRHPLGSFYAVTFTVSWGFWIPDALSGGHVSHVAGLLGPLIGAVTVTWFTRGASGLRDLGARMTRWRVPVRWYGCALAPSAVALAVAAVAAPFTGSFPSVDRWEQMNGFPSLGVWTIAVILLVNAFGEETGWRGYALPRFRLRHDPLEASLLLSVPWIVWHAPTFFIDSGYRGFPITFLLGFVIGIVAGAVVLTWLYEGARSSILIVALWHLSLNLGSATTAGEGAPGVVVTMFVIVWALWIARRWRTGTEIQDATT